MYSDFTMLLEIGTDVNAEDMAGHTPLQLARSRLRLLTEDSLLRATPFHLRHEIAQVLFSVSYSYKMQCTTVGWSCRL